MKPYGLRSNDDIERFGSPTKIGKLSARNRRMSRRLMHKQGRQDAKREIKKVEAVEA